MNNGVSDTSNISLTSKEQCQQMSLSGANGYCIRAVLDKQSADIHEYSMVILG